MKYYSDRDRKLDKRRRGHKSMKMDGKGTRTQYRQRVEKYIGESSAKNR